MSRNALESSGAIRLAEAGFVIDAITGALDTLEGISSNLLADALVEALELGTNALKYAGHGIHQITSALNSALGLGDHAIASLLKGVGYTLDQVAGAIDSFFSLSDEALAEVLGAVGYAASELESFFGDAWDAIEGGFCGLFGC